MVAEAALAVEATLAVILAVLTRRQLSPVAAHVLALVVHALVAVHTSTAEVWAD
jgi:hypothetical protein